MVIDEMKDVVYLNPHELKPYGLNAKKHDKRQIDNVAKSIENYGWAQPIVVDGDMVIIIGHCRQLAAIQLGLDSVPVLIRDDLTEEQARALRIVDNKSNESEWDAMNLSADLKDLPLDLQGFNFDFEAVLSLSLSLIT